MGRQSLRKSKAATALLLAFLVRIIAAWLLHSSGKKKVPALSTEEHMTYADITCATPRLLEEQCLCFLPTDSVMGSGELRLVKLVRTLTSFLLLCSHDDMACET